MKEIMKKVKLIEHLVSISAPLYRGFLIKVMVSVGLMVKFEILHLKLKHKLTKLTKLTVKY